MKIQLLSKPDKKLNAKVQVALNRGIPAENIVPYFKNKIEDINPPTAFNEELLSKGAKLLVNAIKDNKKVFVVVDSDVDGMTSSALLINYLSFIVPAWTQTNVEWGLHEGKQHGLNDWVEYLTNCHFDLVICPDSASNDLPQIEELHNLDTDVLILDHHLSNEGFSPYAITINSQYDYPNPDLSGVGVVYQFCRYLDSLMDVHYADNFLDLVATGLQGDMMNIRTLETKELIFLGFQDENIHNPLINGLIKKNEFSFSKSDYMPSPQNNLKVSPLGASFFIVPLLNALCRSGTMEEKELVFSSMLTMKAFDIIPSNKRGHKPGDTETRVEQALRCCTNVKNRQTRLEDAGMALLEGKVAEDDMLNNKVLVFTLAEGEIDRNIAGLVANKLAPKYQRPCCVVTKTGEEYSGSMRGYTRTGIDNFKAVAEGSDACSFCLGHENAAGIGINDPDQFIKDMNAALKDVSTDIVYHVDYMWESATVDADKIIEMAELNDYIGTGFERPQVYVKDIKVTKDNLFVMAKNTLKISLPNGVDIIKFAATDEEITELLNSKINMVCKCVINEYGFMRNPQLICIDYEVQEEKPLSVIESWGF